jgi:hypothetical protein
MAKDKRISEKEFGLNLNLDDSDKSLSAGDARYILNCLSGINKEGQIGSVENEKGNQLVSIELPEGVSTCLGSARDEQKNAIVYFLHNDLNNHSILRYNIDTNDIDYILNSLPVLNFYRYQRQGYITHAHIIGDLLYWVDGENEARKINMDQALRFTDPEKSGGYSEITEETIVAIKPPPIIAPTTRMFTDSTRASNFIRQTGQQFAYRYLYDDLEKSVFSPWSRNVYPPWDPFMADDIQNQNLEEYWRKDDSNNIPDVKNQFPFGSYQNAYNGVKIDIVYGSKIVTQIEIAVRTSELDDWNVFETIDNLKQIGEDFPEPGDTFTVSYYNDRVGVTVSDNAVLKSQDFFPIAPHTQQYTHLNNLVYANYTDGYDLEDIDVDVSYNAERFLQFPWHFVGGSPEDNPFFVGSISIPLDASGDFRAFIPPTILSVQEGYLLAFMIPEGVDVNRYPYCWYRVTDEDVTDQTIFNDNIAKALTNQGVDSRVVGGIVRLYVATSEDATRVPDFCFVYNNASHWSEPTFKQAAYHQVGIQYFDRWGRRGPSQISDESRIYLPSWGEYKNITGTLGADTHGYMYTLDVAINHRPPEWAHSYQIVYSGALNIGDFIQFPFRQATEEIPDTEPVQFQDRRGGVAFTGWTEFKDQNERVQRAFTFEVGDFIREMKRGNVSGVNFVAQMSENNKSEQIVLVDLVDLDEIPTSVSSFNEAQGDPDDNKIQTAANTADTGNGQTSLIVSSFTETFVNPITCTWTLLVGAAFKSYTVTEVAVLINGLVAYSRTDFGSFTTSTFLTDSFAVLSTFDTTSGKEFRLRVTLSYSGSSFDSSGTITFEEKTSDINGPSLIEQYKRVAESEILVFNEIGKTYRIFNPGTSTRYHGGDVLQATDLSTPAIVNLERGDAWIRPRVYDDYQYSFIPLNQDFRYPYQHVVEDPNFSDYYESSDKGYGRPVAENPDYRRTDEYSGLRHTGSFIEGTKTNQLNEVDFDFVEYVSQTNGRINALREVGFTLKVIQDKRVTSIYLGRQTTTNPEGTQDMILSDRVFASINPSELDYGTRHPESVLKHDRHVYFFDVNYGKVIRDAANGMTPVSDYKAAKLFRDLSDEIYARGLDNVFCYGSWNDEQESYVFSFLNGRPNADNEGPQPPVPGETPPFNPPINPPSAPEVPPPAEIQDSDAIAFWTAAGITDPDLQSAINTLVRQLKNGPLNGSNLWTSVFATGIIYPFVGGDFEAHSYNLRDPEVGQLIFNGAGSTHSALGYITDGLAGTFADTVLVTASDVGAQDDFSMGVYLQDDYTASNNAAMGNQVNTNERVLLQTFQGADLLRFQCHDGTVGMAVGTVTSAKGFSLGVRRASNDAEVYKDGVSVGTLGTGGGTIPATQSMFIGARNNNETDDLNLANTFSFALAGTGMTDDQAADLHIAVENFQLALGRSTAPALFSAAAEVQTQSTLKRAKEGSFTVSFQEISNRWKTYHSYQPEHMQFLGKEFISFEDGALWRHNSDGSLRMNFYGIQYEMVLEPISNIEGDAVKTFHAIAIQANKAPLKVESFIPATDFLVNGMYSRVLRANFAPIEDNYYAALKKDLFTPITGSDIFKLNNGRELRGNVCKFRITYDNTDRVIVTRLIVDLDHSLISG